MISFQKIIKYGAIAFAFVLIFGILSSIMYGVNSILYFLDSNEKNDIKNMKIVDINESVNVLDIDIDKVDLKIKIDDDFRIELSDDERISYSDDGERLIIDEKKLNLFDDESEVVIYIPEEKVFTSVFMNTTAGILEVDSIKTEKLDLELGMGSVKINNLEVTSSTNINTGVGEFILSDGVINNLELDMGMGDVSVNSKILGKSEIDAGIGALVLNLIGSLKDYKIDVDEGIGNIKIDGDSLVEKGPYGTGNNYIDIDGGIGEINIKFND